MENVNKLQRREYFIVGSFLAFLITGGAAFIFFVERPEISTRVGKQKSPAVFVVESQGVKVPRRIHQFDIDQKHDRTSMMVDGLEPRPEEVWVEGIASAPEDMWVESFEATVIGAPDTLLHHATLARYENTYYRRADPRPCPPVRESIWAVDNFNPRRAYTIPKPYGLFIAKGEKIDLWGMFHNTSDVTYEQASVRVTIRGEFGVKPDDQHKALKVLHLSTEQCVGIGIFNIPPRTENFVRNIQYDPFIIPEDGEITQLAPHFHYWDGAKLEVVKLNGKELWRFYPPESGPIPFRIDPANPKFPYPVKKGDRLEFYVVYDNPGDTPITDAMGMVIFSLHPHQ